MLEGTQGLPSALPGVHASSLVGKELTWDIRGGAGVLGCIRAQE